MWRSVEENSRERRSRRAVEVPVRRHQADPVTGQLIVAQAPLPRRDRVGGGLVVGSAELRQAPIEIPPFYEPVTEQIPVIPPPRVAPPPPVAPPRPVSVPRPAPAPAPAPAAPAPTPRFVAPQPTQHDRALVRQAWDVVSGRADQLVRNFYAEVFLALGDEALQMFPSDMVTQRDDFGRALVQWVVTDDLEAMAAHLTQLGADHRKFDVAPRHYEAAGVALVSAWSHLAGSAWTPQIEAAVVGSYTRLASVMIDGAMRTRDQPASWGATVIAHERILGDFAVLRIQPDAPYSYKAGQYLTLELAGHRRQWRQMSIASAPRADNTFDIHVRAVTVTGVSGALVMHTKPGARLRLGPPRGNDLVVEPGTVPGGLLCVCSGTGSAPISAVVESIMGWRDCPPLYAFVGGRTTKDMYPVDQLNQLARDGGKAERVRVYGVVSDDPDYTGYRGRVEQVVPNLLDWAGLSVDVLVAGPNTMIASTVTGLTDLGVPLEKIHFDQYEVAV
jgi:NAD(P)H-flavin reductase/hemoglobin-like flavoprotein